jgi:predicted RNase H-like HicB family nuclease
MSKTIISTQKTTEKHSFNIRVREDGGVFLAEIPELNISVRAGTWADARGQAAEAAKQFFEDAKRQGNLLDVLANLKSKTKPNP